ncbi:MAG: protein translocase subunit SecD [Candidatus Paceibacterota bacterium]
MMSKIKLTSLAILAGAIFFGYFVYVSETEEDGLASSFPFQFGLDIQGGAHLVYNADVSGIEGEAEIRKRMNALRGLIEDRVNALGVSEPLVQIERGGLLGEGEYRLIVELPGVDDVDEAIAAIGETPVLEFRLAEEDVEEEDLIEAEEIELDTEEGDLEEVDMDLDEENEVSEEEQDTEEAEQSTEDPEEDEENEEGEDSDEDNEEDEDIREKFAFTGLDGSMLDNAQFARNPTTGEPLVQLQFDSEGRKLFADLTRENVGRQMAIFLDGEPVTVPVIREAILAGEATISGDFSVAEARDLARRLQAGALPLPIDIASTQTVGATLGQRILDDGVLAGFFGLLLVAGFLILWYRLSGLVAVTALAVYVVVMLSLFKLIPVTLTAAGIAGFILSVGMAVDANVIIFERIKEELRNGRNIKRAVEEGFSRAWLSIRDANISSLITAVILYWFGTPLVQGFALVFFIGVLVSMITAISVTRTFLLAVAESEKEGNESGVLKLLFYSGLEKPDTSK